MLKQTLKIVSYLFGSLLTGIVTTLLVDSTDDVAVEKRIRKTKEKGARVITAVPLKRIKT